MSAPIEDYALIGDCHSAALVCKSGSIDWLCLPRFDSPACFAALVGSEKHGRWLIAPRGEVKRVTRKYLGASLVLETTFETEEGAVTLVDFMVPRNDGKEGAHVVRIVRGVRGRVPMRFELIVRFDYGSIVPWVHRKDEALHIDAGPDSLRLCAPVETHGQNLTTVSDFEVGEGEELPFVLTWYPSYGELPKRFDARHALTETASRWRAWSKQCIYQGEWREQVERSVLTLKALTHMPTGGITAAVTTSLPERIGGVRNWDYRFCWVRDATFTLYALLISGFRQEAIAWREWLLRAVAGNPSELQILYGLAGERRIPETEIGWLPGYEGSRPVRVGNGAATQFQLDVYGELMDAMHQCYRAGIHPDAEAWKLQKKLLDFLETGWSRPDDGIWEVRGPQRHFTHSKVMAWVAFDRGIKSIERFGMRGPLDKWKALRDQIRADVLTRGWNESRGAFTQYFGSTNLDASLLMMPLVGFLPATDPRMRSTIETIERELVHDGFVLRYVNQSHVDALPEGEGAFLACSFWLADCLHLMGRRDDARRVFERLLATANDVGLLAEEYDPRAKRLLGNFPQAFSHVCLVNTAQNLSRDVVGPAEHRLGT